MISKDDFESRIGPYVEGLVEATWGAFREWEEYGPRRIPHEAGTQTTIIHDLLVKHLKLVFANRPEVTFLKVRGRTVMCLGNDFIVSIKKLNDSLCSSNIPTQQAMDFLYQQPLPGLDPATNLNFGYVYNETRSGWDSIWVTCPYGRTLLHKLCLERVSEPENMLELPLTEAPPVEQARRRLRRKETIKGRETDAPDASG